MHGRAGNAIGEISDPGKSCRRFTGVIVIDADHQQSIKCQRRDTGDSLRRQSTGTTRATPALFALRADLEIGQRGVA